MRLHLLLIEDSTDDAILVLSSLESAGFVVEAIRVENEEGLRAALAHGPYDIVLSDYRLPRFDALSALAVVRSERPDLPVIIVSGAVGEETAAAAVSAGACDFVLKGNLERLPSRVARRVAEAEQRREALKNDLALREMEERFRAMADSAPVYVWMSSSEARCVFVNKGWLDFTGRTFDEEVGRGWMERCHPDDADRIRADYLAAFHARVEFCGEMRVLRKDGEYRWLQTRGVPRYQGDGAFLGYIGSCSDVTDFKRAELDREQLLAREREAKEEVERQGRLKDEFLATLSHELRTPMAAITGWCEMLQRGVLTPAEQSKALQAIDRNAKAQLKLITDLLDISRVITGKLALDTGDVDLVAVLRAGLDAVRLSADAKGIDLALVEFGETLKVSGDPARLQQVAWNLLSNAIKFTPRGGRVTVSAGREDSCAVVRVVDTGDGIASDFLPRVFDRFSQADRSTTRLQGGLGLGLSIVRHLIEMHGGSVFATSEGKGYGSSFGFRLPILALGRQAGFGVPEVEEAPFSMAPRHGGTGRLALEGRSIVVVDDNEDAVVLLATLLQFHGATVYEACCAQEAYEAVVTKDPDLLLSDIGMPEEDGFSLIRRVRRAGAESGSRTALPAIALSAHAHVACREEALEAGFQACLTKPVDAARLVEAIVLALEAERV